jgi:hypothetical protein
MAEAVARFPDVGGFVLAGRRVRLPSDLPEHSLTVVAFRKWHQRLVDGWIDWSQRNHPDLSAIEVPVISRGYRWQRPFIDGGMIAGIRDRQVLARTITVYTDVPAFLQALDLPDDSTVAALVLGRDGTVHACARGPVGSATTAVVEAAVTQAGG